MFNGNCSANWFWLRTLKAILENPFAMFGSKFYEKLGKLNPQICAIVFGEFLTILFELYLIKWIEYSFSTVLALIRVIANCVKQV